MSKVLERLINKRIMNFLETNALLSPEQFGFRSGRSTDDAVHELTDHIVTNLDNKRKCVTVFLDLAKAFDTVPIPLLLQKLERIGVRGLPLQLLMDYFTCRKQRVKIDNWISDELSVHYGVPQGSVLGPSLFLVYINDLLQLHLKHGKLISFADDTALFFSGENWEEVFQTAQHGFNEVCQWLKHNVLTLNLSKTKYVAFAPRRNLLPPSTLSIMAHTCSLSNSSCLCSPLQNTDVIRYLGVYIDQTLTFKPHIDILVTRIRKLIYIFKTLRHVADLRTIKMVYSALCQSIVNYCITSWGGAGKVYLLEVERAQRAVLKVGAGLPFRYPTAELYKLWDVLTVRQSFILSIVSKQHKQMEYEPNLNKDKRKKLNVCPTSFFRTILSQRFFCFLGGYLYNKINKSLTIYPLRRPVCKLTVCKWLKTLDYQATESLLIPIR